MDIHKWFEIGMKRTINPIIPPGTGGMFKINLGTGKYPLGCDLELDLPNWDATKQAIPAKDGSVSTIFANHFFEHLTGDQAIVVLRECERVLHHGGQLNVVVPYYRSQLQFECLDHKSYWNEATWGNIIKNSGYDLFGDWTLKVNVCFIMGVVERNIAMFTQLVKDDHI